MAFRILLAEISRLLTDSPNSLIHRLMVGIKTTNSKEWGKRKRTSSQMRLGTIQAMRITWTQTHRLTHPNNLKALQLSTIKTIKMLKRFHLMGRVTISREAIILTIKIIIQIDRLNKTTTISSISLTFISKFLQIGAMGRVLTFP